MFNFVILIIFILIMALLMTHSICLYGKTLFYFISDGADLRVCNLVHFQNLQFLLLASIVLTSFEVINEFLLSCLIIYPIIFFYLFFLFRFTGYKGIYFNKNVKNVIYIFITLMFFLIIGLNLTEKEIKFSLNEKFFNLYSIYVDNYKFNSYFTYLTFFYCVFCFIFIVLFDWTEKRSKLIKISDTICVLFLLLTSLSMILRNVFGQILLLLGMLLPNICFIFEEYSILKKCKNEIESSNYIKKLFKITNNLPKKRKLYNARLIAKMTIDNPEIKGFFPKNKKYGELVELISSFKF